MIDLLYRSDQKLHPLSCRKNDAELEEAEAVLSSCADMGTGRPKMLGRLDLRLVLAVFWTGTVFSLDLE